MADSNKKYQEGLELMKSAEKLWVNLGYIGHNTGRSLGIQIKLLY